MQSIPMKPFAFLLTLVGLWFQALESIEKP